MRDHQQGHVNDRDRICGAQLPSHRRKADPEGMVVVDDDIAEPDEVESADE